jgi:hypothetical protein
MAGIATGGEIQPRPTTKNLGRRRAAGIYGAIITAAILDTAGGHVSTAALVVSVVVTLLVYWVAEEYAELLGEQVEAGFVPSWNYIRGSLAATWPMVSASFAPLVVLVLARLAGASIQVADNFGLVVAIVLLMIHGWLAARSARLHGIQLIFTTSIAAALGLVMVALKDLVLLHLHLSIPEPVSGGQR